MNTKTYGFMDELAQSDEFSEEDLALLKGDMTSQNSEAILPEQQGEDQTVQAPEDETTFEQEISNINNAGAKDQEPTDEKTEETGGSEENRNRMVPHGALHQERERHKETKGELQSLRSEMQQLQKQFDVGNERLRLVTEAIQQQGQFQQQQAQKLEAEQNPPPNPEEDLFGYFRYNQEQQNQQINELKDLFTKTQDQIQDRELSQQQQRQEQQQQASFETAYVNDARAFMNQKPDFHEAYAHVLQGRDAELQLMGYTNPQDRAQIIQSEEQSIAVRMLEQGKSPAEFIYNWATQRGYQPKAANPEMNSQAGEVLQSNTQTDTNIQNGVQQPPQQQSSQANGMDKVAQIADAAAANKSLSGAGGGEVQTDTVRTLASMSDTEFTRLMEKHPNEIMRALGAPDGTVF